MAVKAVMTDVQVIVRPSNKYGYKKMAALVDDCASIVEQIKRHVDEVGECEVDQTWERQCEFCGSVWTELSNAYNGGCCVQDEENNPENT